LGNTGDDGLLIVIGAMRTVFRRGVERGQISVELGEGLAGFSDALEQTSSGKKAIVITELVLTEKDVSTHFAAE
jgi:hypothetical protein